MEKLKAVFFDQDGVIIETERDGHRVAFNSAFKEFDLGFEWNPDYYHDLLKVGGGKERIKYYLDKINYKGSEYIKDPDNFIKKIHLRKTEIFVELIKFGKLPLRPGIRRLMEEINSRGVLLGICTTSNEKAAFAVEKCMLQNINVDFILAGDIVKNKKPDPEIYKMALEKSGISGQNAFVIEDSRIGVLAGTAAGIHVIATVNEYTKNEDVSLADIIVDNLEADGGITFDMLESYL